MITGAIQHAVRRADALLGGVYLTFFRERSTVVTFLFHSLFRDEDEIADRSECIAIDHRAGRIQRRVERQ